MIASKPRTSSGRPPISSVSTRTCALDSTSSLGIATDAASSRLRTTSHVLPQSAGSAYSPARLAPKVRTATRPIDPSATAAIASRSGASRRRPGRSSTNRAPRVQARGRPGSPESRPRLRLDRCRSERAGSGDRSGRHQPAHRQNDEQEPDGADDEDHPVDVHPGVGLGAPPKPEREPDRCRGGADHGERRPDADGRQHPEHPQADARPSAEAEGLQDLVVASMEGGDARERPERSSRVLPGPRPTPARGAREPRTPRSRTPAKPLASPRTAAHRAPAWRGPP